ncbi:MAG: 2-amino-4-hydroxy-6-hydroxymethyldihydropteridine diphosphokinase [Candidatus Sumerlaeia bacterium]|nr:2-amino-4-hydroxy-6-hydroxymethyldihydropteridine diphosphokinase [Candidatus Sumerlaeia bacterium]
MSVNLAAVAVGSNVGDRQRYLDMALARVDALQGVDVVATSRVYQSEGWGRDDLKPFLNAAFLVRLVDIQSHDFLEELQKIEDALGRQRSLKWGPRTIDLDLLAIDEIIVNSDFLTHPPPRIAHRPFVYHPLSDLGVEAWNALTKPSPEGLEIEAGTTPLETQPIAWNVKAPVAEVVHGTTASEEETLNLGRELGGVLSGGEIICLDAPMGVGKSVLARGIARGLRIDGPIQSPSYTLCRRYETGRLILEHWDFYRLGSVDDLESTGYFDPMTANMVRVIEWASSFPEAVTAPFLRVRLEQTGVEDRRITFGDNEAPPPFLARAVMEKLGRSGR